MGEGRVDRTMSVEAYYSISVDAVRIVAMLNEDVLQRSMQSGDGIRGELASTEGGK